MNTLFRPQFPASWLSLLSVFQLISGQYVCGGSHNGSPMVEIEVIGIPADCCKQKSKVISRNAVNPIWNEVNTFQVYFSDLAFLRFSVVDMNSNHLAAQRIIPLRALRPGEEKIGEILLNWLQWLFHYLIRCLIIRSYESLKWKDR